MKKLYQGLFIVLLMLSASPLKAQVLGYPGATWMFQSPQFWGICFEVNEKWEYTADTVILGTNAKKIHVTQKVANGFPPTFFTTYHQNKYFHVNGDTAWLFVSFDSTWQEVYNFSVQIGDTVQNPLGSRLNGWANSCPDSIPYNDIAVVTNTGITTIDGQSLKYYTLHYYTGHDSTYLDQTFIERVISLGYWFPNDEFWCGAVPECINPTLVCYKDNGMMTDSTCNDLSWFETLSLNDEMTLNEIHIYPNPVHDYLAVQNPQAEAYQILSYEGKLVATYTATNSINVSQFSSGLYFITNESRTWFKKFIKD